MLTHHPTYDPQKELLHQLCAEAEEAIRDSASAEEARAKGETICGKFEDRCESPLVLNAARIYIEDIIAKAFADRR